MAKIIIISLFIIYITILFNHYIITHNVTNKSISHEE
jgi:hypothetical protein